MRTGNLIQTGNLVQRDDNGARPLRTAATVWLALVFAVWGGGAAGRAGRRYAPVRDGGARGAR